MLLLLRAMIPDRQPDNVECVRCFMLSKGGSRTRLARLASRWAPSKFVGFLMFVNESKV